MTEPSSPQTGAAGNDLDGSDGEYDAAVGAAFDTLMQPVLASLHDDAPETTHSQQNGTTPVEMSKMANRETSSQDGDGGAASPISSPGIEYVAPEKPPASQETRLRSPSQLRHSRPVLPRSITLNDVISNPLEEEAETAIIQALEEKEQELQEENEVERPTLLPAVPEDADVFETEQDATETRTATDSGPGGRRASTNQQDTEKKSIYRQGLKSMATELRMMQMGTSLTDPSQGGYLKKAEMAAEMKEEPSERGTIDAIDAARIGAVSEHTPIVKPPDKLVDNASILFRRSTKSFRPDARKTASNYDVEAQQTNPVDKKSDDHHEATPSGRSSRRRRRCCARGLRRTHKEWLLFKDFIALRRKSLLLYLKIVIFLIGLPAIGVAALLYYGVGNPILGSSSSSASYSWWVLFVLVRQVVTFCISKGNEIFFIEFLSLRSRAFVQMFGPFITLMIVQARGWPYIITLWAIWDFCLLHGDGAFAHHWLYWQDAIEMFNEKNQSGEVVSNEWYTRLLGCAILAGVATSLKRVWIALQAGKRNYRQYGPQLEKLVRKMLLISEVAFLAKEIEESYVRRHHEEVATNPDSMHRWGTATSRSNIHTIEEDEETQDQAIMLHSAHSAADKSDVPSNDRFSWTKYNGRSSSSVEGEESDSESESPKEEAPAQNFRPRLNRQEHMRTTQQVQLMRLLEEWEEPEISPHLMGKKATIRDILHYRQSLAYLDDRYPFSLLFGPANTRLSCIESAQKVYERLLLHTPGAPILSFETIALVALDEYGELNQEKIKALVHLFRPGRDGTLSLVDFVKSCDTVYKRLRMLRAATANSSQIDKAYEGLVNILYYFVLGMIILAILQLDPWTLFLSVSSLILSFSFMFGGAASKYFEGILLILVRKPYDIGDRVAISDPEKDTSSNGSATWFVEGITLYATTARLAATNEVATYANGALASSRIINAARSPKATVYVYMKFGIDVPYERVKIFQTTVENFVKQRPREWISLNGFRATRVEIDQGFIEYVIVVQHREAWQNVGSILQSKADLSSYGLEVSKKLDMRYTAPPLPVNLGMKGGPENAQMERQDTAESESADVTQTPDAPRGMLDLGNLFQKKTR